MENDFAYLQGEANTELERLHKLAEVDRKEVFSSKDGEGAAAADVAVARRFKDYRDTMVNLTVATRTFMGMGGSRGWDGWVSTRFDANTLILRFFSLICSYLLLTKVAINFLYITIDN